MGGNSGLVNLVPVLVILVIVVFAGIMVLQGNMQSPTALAAGGNANLAPEWSGTKEKYVLEQNTPVLLNLGGLFNDPEGQALTFSFAGAKDVSVFLEDSTLSITPDEGFKGTRTVTVIASDGENIVRKQILVEAGSETAQQDVLPETTSAQTESQPSGFSTSGFQTTASSCGAYGESTTLDQDISNASTCIVLTGNDLVFDCAGYSITYCSGGGCSGSAHGITATNHKNITIQNCRIITSGNVAQMNGIRFMTINESLINNTNITTNYITGATGSNGVSLQSNAKYNTILNSIINITCASTPCYGVSATGSPYNNITRTRITVTPAATNGAGIDAMNSPGLNISYSNIAVLATAINSCNGIILRSANQSIHSTNVTINGSNYINALNLTNANNSVVSGSRFTCMASMESRAVAVDSSENMKFIENRMTANGTSVIQALLLSDSGGEFSLTNLALLGPSGAGMVIQNSKGTSFNATTINGSSNSQMWASMYSNPEKNNFTNTTFMNGNGSINILGDFNFTNGYLDQSGLYIQNNKAYLNSSNLTGLNQTAIVTLYSIPLISPAPTVDWNDDGNYENCPPDVCTILSSGQTLVFNVSHFTSYSTTGTFNITGCPVTINTSAILGNDISSATTCITVNADNVEIDCQGHKIGYNTGSGNDDYGVSVIYRNNVTVRNCIINDSIAAGNSGYGVYVYATNRSLVANSTIQSYGSIDNSPIYIYSGAYNRIENNSLLPRSSTGEVGLVIASSTGNNATGNTIATFIAGASNLGVELTGSTRCRLAYNNITTDGDSSDYGISMSSSDNITIAYNAITARGTTASHGIYASSGIDNSIIGNSIYAEGNGIQLLSAFHKAVLSFNNISTSSSYSGIYLLYSNLTNATNTWFNTTGHWINSSNSYNNEFHNTTFETTGGKINIPYNFTVNDNQDINRARLIPSSTTAKINTVALPFLNTTGIISLYGVGASVPVPTVDYEDDGSYVRCGDVCTELYKSGSTYAFNVTHFTTFSTSETNITGCPVTINESTTLAHSISSNTTCITIGANNLVLDCNGSTITFGINGAPGAAGIKSDTKINITVANCTVILGNASARYAYGMNFTSGGNITAINNIVRVNGTGNNTGIHLFYPDYNHLLYNTVMVHGTQDSNYGIRFANSYYNNITGNNVSVNGTTNNMAMRLAGFSYSNVSANNATAKGTLGDNYGIYLFSSSILNTIERNKVTVYGDTGLDYGIYLFTSVSNNNITGNTISTSGPGTDYHGIVLSSSVNSNRFYFNNITTAGDNSYGAYMQTADNRFFNTIFNTTAWIYSDFMSTNNFTNTTFVRRYGSLMLRNFSLDDLHDITESVLNITNNRTYVNTSRYPALNTSGIVTLNNIAFTDPKPMVDYQDDGSYADCPGSVCTELSYTPGVSYVFNVTHFTSYASAENVTTITGCPVEINESTILSQNIASNDTCITINGDSLTLDCAGRTITYNANNGAVAYGISSNYRNNVTIKDCVIVLGNRSSANSHGIYFIATNNSRIQNNTLLINGTSSDMGMYLSASCNNSIIGNRIFGNSSGTTNHGIFTVSYAANHLIENNTIATNGSSGNTGIYLQSAGNRINFNNISAKGDDSHGLHLAMSAENNSATGNRIFTNGTFSYGIYLLSNANNNNISSNTIKPRGSEAYGIVMVNADNNRFERNNATIGSQSQYGVYVQLSTANIFNNTIINSTENWAYIDDASTADFTATTFQSEKGSILLDNFTIDRVLYDITGSNLNTSLNRSFLNSSALPALNTTGIIMLYGITAGDPKPMVDWEDDGTYEECPTCTELGYSGGVFSFNTTHFTAYSSSENSTAVSGCPVTINDSTTLSQDISSSGTCITVNGNALTLDCRGHTITYSNAGFGYGIYVMNKGRIIIKDCVLVLGNNSATGTRAIYLTNSNYSLVQNNTLLINGTDTNDGINLFKSNNNTILQNIVFANNSGLSNTGIYFGTGSGNNTAEGNSIVMNGTQANPGIYSYGPGNHRILYNNVTTYGNYSYGIYLLFTSQNNSIIGNTITTEGAFAYGLNFGTDVNDNNITGNHIVSRGDFAHGINLNSLYRNRFEYNNITVNSDTQYGINLQLAPSTFNHTIINSTDNWIYGDSLSISEFEDTIFQSAMGSIKLDNFTIPGVVVYDIISGYLNTSHNQSHLDSANLPALNTSGVITLYGITSTDPKPMVSWDPNNVFIDCPADVCTELSYSGGVYVFNVSHFTLFGSQENATPVPPGPSGGGGGSGGQYVGIPRWPSPPAGQMPVQPCVENWECEDWSRCENGAQSRVCVELNGCGSEHKPPTERECTVERVIREEPIPEYVPVPEVEKPAEPEPSRLLTILPLVIDSLLIALALLAIMGVVMGYDTRSKVWFKALVIVLMLSSLAMLVWHYLANNELLWFQTGAFLVIIIAFIIMQAVDRSRRKLPEGFESTAPMPEFEEHEESRLPAGVEYSSDELPEPAIQQIPSKVPEHAGPRKIYFLTPVGEAPEQEIAPIRPKRGKKPKKEPKVRVVRPREMPAEPMDLDAVLRRSKKTLTKVGNTIKTLKKKKRK